MTVGSSDGTLRRKEMRSLRKPRLREILHPPELSAAANSVVGLANMNNFPEVSRVRMGAALEGRLDRTVCCAVVSVFAPTRMGSIKTIFFQFPSLKLAYWSKQLHCLYR